MLKRTKQKIHKYISDYRIIALYYNNIFYIILKQAELVSVEGKEIEGHYVLAKEFIQKWNSTSDCYLLVEGVEHTLTVITNN